jgi:hypothetical protein
MPEEWRSSIDHFRLRLAIRVAFRSPLEQLKSLLAEFDAQYVQRNILLEGDAELLSLLVQCLEMKCEVPSQQWAFNRLLRLYQQLVEGTADSQQRAYEQFCAEVITDERIWLSSFSKPFKPAEQLLVRILQCLTREHLPIGKMWLSTGGLESRIGQKLLAAVSRLDVRQIIAEATEASIDRGMKKPRTWLEDQVAVELVVAALSAGGAALGWLAALGMFWMIGVWQTSIGHYDYVIAVDLVTPLSLFAKSIAFAFAWVGWMIARHLAHRQLRYELEKGVDRDELQIHFADQSAFRRAMIDLWSSEGIDFQGSLMMLAQLRHTLEGGPSGTTVWGLLRISRWTTDLGAAIVLNARINARSTDNLSPTPEATIENDQL